jgi:hypothetical protein
MSSSNDSITLSVESMKKYKPFALSPEQTVFLQRFLAVLIESRTGSVKASEAGHVGELHNGLASYLQQVVEAERKAASQQPKPSVTSGLPLPSVKEESKESESE